MNDVALLDVLLHGKQIGTLTSLPGDRTIFTFSESYVADKSRPTLSLGFKSNLGELITNFKPHQTRLMPFFSNLLPEGHLRTYLAKRAGVHPEREFLLLKALGADLPGAVTVRSTEHAQNKDPETETGDKPKTAKRADRLQPLRFSLAGVQMKFSAVQEAHGGLTIPATGMNGSWIVKLPSTIYPGVPENEFSMMTLARQIGIDVPATNLVSIEEIGNLPEEVTHTKGNALAVERFDRLTNGSSVHIEDFAQVFGVYPAEKYSRASNVNIASVIATESTDRDIAEFVRRLTFNTLIGNGDMHLKNWSMIYLDMRQASLAPAYDFVSTIPYIENDRSALKYSRTQSFSEYTEEELTHLAARAGLPRHLVLETARETVESFWLHWQEQKSHLPLAKRVVKAIDKHLNSVPIARARNGG
jgi:serine/threonine-protein kinase HipA